MRQGGFTLLELLVVIAIIGVIASVTFVRSDLMESDAEIKAAAGQIINMAKRTRQQSISVAEFRGIFPSYGLHLEKGDDSFIIYANCIPDDNENNTVDHEDNFAYNAKAHEDCDDVMTGGPSDPAKVEDIDLKEGVVIHDIKVDSPADSSYTNDTVDNVSINYLRPIPVVWITVDVGEPGEYIIPTGSVTLVLRDKAHRYEQELTFYTTALVETNLRRLKD